MITFPWKNSILSSIRTWMWNLGFVSWLYGNIFFDVLRNIVNMQWKLSGVTNALNVSSIFTCFFILCKYWKEPKIIAKIVCDVYIVCLSISMFYCALILPFFLSLMCSVVANDLIWKKKKMFGFARKYHKMSE